MSKEKSQRPFREVVPGVLVSRDIKMSVPHPDQAFVLRDEEDQNSWSVGGSLAVFSSEEAASEYMKKVGLTGAVVKPFEWDQLVDKFGNGFGDCIVDHSGEEGFQTVVPLRKGI